MKYLLDTDTCIALIRANPQALGWLAQLMPSEVGVSTGTCPKLAKFSRRCSTR